MTAARDSYETPALLAWRRATDLPLLIASIGTLPMLLLEFERDTLTRGDQLFIDFVNVAVLVMFAVDYVVELALAQRRRDFARSEWTSLVIVIAQAIAILPGFSPFGILRLLRAARLLRFILTIARVVAIGGAASSQGARMVRKNAGSFALGTAGLTWICSAVAFTLAEDVGVDGRLHSFFDGLWWSTTTITTVGYGDVYPVTAVGRVVGGFTMLVGISTFAIVTAKVAEFLVRSDLSVAAADADAEPLDLGDGEAA